METTVDVKSIINSGNLLTDNFLSKEDLNTTIQFIDYNLKYSEISETGSDGANNDLKSLYNDKINALNIKKNFGNRDHFKQTQNWVGYITEIHEDYFTAKVDDNSETGTYEVADFYFKTVSYEDQKLISLGSIFYWSVGYEDRGGQIYKESFIRFQRLPPWNIDEVDKVVDQSSKLRSKLKWED